MATSELPVLPYSRLRRPLSWKPYLLGVLTVPALIVTMYAPLRVSGLILLEYHQGEWEMGGGSGCYLVDVLCSPLAIFEVDLNNFLRWRQEPTV